MLPTRSILLFTFLFFSFISAAQQRVGLDLSSRMDNLMITVHYQKVLKNHFLYSAGVFAGSNGRAFIPYETNADNLIQPAQTPYREANRPISDSTRTFILEDYNTTAKSFGVQLGLGYFFEFGVKHGIRTNANATFGFANTKLGGHYRSTDNSGIVYASHRQQQFIGSISLEAFHTIRLTGRTTFNYGLKVPYYFNADKARFNPTTKKDLLYGFEPQLSIGMTYVVGKCD